MKDILWLTLILNLFSCSTNFQWQWDYVTKSLPDSLISFEYQTINFDDLNPDTSKYLVTVDVFPPAIPTVYPGGVVILIPDGNEIQISVALVDRHSEVSETRKFLIPVYSNPNFQENWKLLSPDTIPTPLTGLQYRVFSTYSQFRQIGKSLAETPLPDNQYGWKSSDEWKGNYTLLYLWYWGCAPCMAIKPSIEKLFIELKDYANLQMISFTPDSIIKFYPDSSSYYIKSAYGVATKETDTGTIRVPVFENVRTQWPLVGSSEEVLNTWGFLSAPTILVLDMECKVRHISTGGPMEPTPSALEYYKKKVTEMVDWVQKYY